MIINILNIPEEGLEIKGSERVRVGDGQSLDAELDLTAELVAGDLMVKGSIDAKLPLECSRCLGSYEYKVSVNIDLAFCSEPEASDENEVAASEMNTGFLSGDELDLAEVVAEQILLNVPMKPLCSDECKGLCPKCGADLNEKDCGCDRSYVNPQFQALQDYLKKDKE